MTFSQQRILSPLRMYICRKRSLESLSVPSQTQFLVLCKAFASFIAKSGFSYSMLVKIVSIINSLEIEGKI